MSRTRLVKSQLLDVPLLPRQVYYLRRMHFGRLPRRVHQMSWVVRSLIDLGLVVAGRGVDAALLTPLGRRVREELAQ
jgi:hypothetical protein